MAVETVVDYRTLKLEISPLRPKGPVLCQPGATPQELDNGEQPSPNGAALLCFADLGPPLLGLFGMLLFEPGALPRADIGLARWADE